MIVKNSVIAESADIHDNSEIINSEIGEFCMVGNGSRFCYSKMGDLSYISANTHVFSSEIGRFSSISWNVSINPAKHDYNRISSHSMLFAKRFEMIDTPFYNQYEKKVIVGNDVWIGCGVVIMPGVTIGDGAIIGANSVITKDVPDYAIMIGVNKFLKWRFADELVSELKEIKWWSYSIDVVKSNIGIISQPVTKETLKRLKENLKTY